MDGAWERGGEWQEVADTRQVGLAGPVVRLCSPPGAVEATEGCQQEPRCQRGSGIRESGRRLGLPGAQRLPMPSKLMGSSDW